MQHQQRENLLFSCQSAAAKAQHASLLPHQTAHASPLLPSVRPSACPIRKQSVPKYNQKIDCRVREGESELNLNSRNERLLVDSSLSGLCVCLIPFHFVLVALSFVCFFINKASQASNDEMSAINMHLLIVEYE